MRLLLSLAAVCVLAGYTCASQAADTTEADTADIDLESEVAEDVSWPEEGNPAPMPEYIVTTMVVERDGAVSECVVDRAEGAGVESMASFCDPGGYYDPILDEDGNPRRVRIRFMSRVVHEPLPD